MAKGRLQKEAVNMARSPPANVHARPRPDDILVWHYVLDGAPGSPYAGGQYHGVLRFPPEYPLKAPSVLMLTPSGRFAVNTRLCLSMSDFHPETWNPAWNVGTILLGLLSFMSDEGDPVTAGSIVTTPAERAAFARASGAANAANKDFVALFPDLVRR